jgi:hypothetical protein
MGTISTKSQLKFCRRAVKDDLCKAWKRRLR